jgi:putative amino-acid transport system substrate-binding protein
MMKNIKQLSLAFTLAAATLGLAACNGSSQEERVLHIGTTGQSFPGSYKEDGKLTGFDVAVAEAVAQKINYKVEWTTADFSGLMGQLEGGKLDTIANVVVITPKRQEKYNFSQPYSTYSSQIVTSSSNQTIKTLADLKGKTVSGVLGSNHVANVKKAFPDGSVTVKTYETRDGAMQDALNGRVDGYVNSGPILRAEISKHHLAFRTVGGALSMESVGFPFNKNQRGDKLREQFNQELQKLAQDGTLKQLSIKFFGEDITVKQSAQ